MATRQRRPKGSGTLCQREDGLWIGRVDAGWTPQGTRRRITVSSKSKSEAQRKLRDAIRRVNAGEVATAGGTRTTVKTWADTWLPIHEAAVRPNVYANDRGAVRKWIVPTIGQRRLADLNPGDVRRLHTAIIGAGRSPTTAGNVHTVFLTMLKAARLEGHSIPERIFDVPKPKPAALTRESIPLDQALALLDAIGRRTDSSRWLVAMFYGMRQGERLGLTWDALDLDSEEPALAVRWQLKDYALDAKVPDWLRTSHLTGRYWLVEVKTKKGERWLPLLPWVAASLAAHRATSPPNNYDLVWTTDKGQPIPAHRDRATWHEVQREAGVSHPSGRPWLLHECRHTLVSIMYANGVPPNVIASIVGHSSLVESYVHVDKASVRAAFDGLARRLQIGV
jgi:integrase